ncbi:hypothetical protein D3C77_631150 [compost metagenome]
MQRLHARKKFRSTVDRCKRPLLQIVQALAQQLLGIVQQLGVGEFNLDQVVLELLDQLFQRCGDLRHRQDTRHVRAALERVQCTLQCVGHRLWKALGAVG